MSAMSISQLARSAGVGVETVRYYQRRGLLADPRPQKTGASGIRHYGPDEERRLGFIRMAQAAGFTLDEIAGWASLPNPAKREILVRVDARRNTAGQVASDKQNA